MGASSAAEMGRDLAVELNSQLPDFLFQIWGATANSRPE